MKVPRVDLRPQERPLKKAILRSISKIIDSGEFILGHNVKALEKEIAAYMGVPDAIGVASGTDALMLSLCALGIKQGDEVITTPFTMAANVEAILHVGAKPVFADVDRKTFNLLPFEIEKRITPKTKAILPVHLFGNPCRMDEITGISREHNIPVVEDVCQAFGAKYKGSRCGSFGVLSALSFFPTKNLGGYGDGGMVLVNDVQYSQKLRRLRTHGQQSKYIYEYLGWNSRLDEMQAAVLLPKLSRIDRWNAARAKAAKLYEKGLAGLSEVETPLATDGGNHIYHLYTIKAQRRAELAAHLALQGIETAVNFPLALHLQLAYNDGTWKEGDFPDAEWLCNMSLSLPMFVGISEKQVLGVCRSIRGFYRK